MVDGQFAPASDPVVVQLQFSSTVVTFKVVTRNDITALSDHLVWSNCTLFLLIFVLTISQQSQLSTEVAPKTPVWRICDPDSVCVYLAFRPELTHTHTHPSKQDWKGHLPWRSPQVCVAVPVLSLSLLVKNSLFFVSAVTLNHSAVFVWFWPCDLMAPHRLESFKEMKYIYNLYYSSLPCSHKTSY